MDGWMDRWFGDGRVKSEEWRWGEVRYMVSEGEV